MRYLKSSLVLVLSLMLAGFALAGDRYMFDKAHTNIGFTVKHLVISNVRGTFTDYDGEIIFDENDITKSSLNVTIKVASVNTSNKKRDTHLKSPDFFNAKEFPVITFKSDKIEKTADGFVAHGDLTIRGVTKKVALPFTFAGPVKGPMGHIRIGASAELTINRQDFGLAWSKRLDTGGLVVSNDVNIKLDIEGVKAMKRGTN